MAKLIVTIENGGSSITEKVVGVKGQSCDQFTVVDSLTKNVATLHTGEYFEGEDNPQFINNQQ